MTEIFELSTWGKVAAFAEVQENPYFSHSEPEEPRYIIESIEVYRGEEGNIYRGLNRSELAEVEERLVDSYERTVSAELDRKVDLRIDTARLEYA